MDSNPVSGFHSTAFCHLYALKHINVCMKEEPLSMVFTLQINKSMLKKRLEVNLPIYYLCLFFYDIMVNFKKNAIFYILKRTFFKYIHIVRGGKSLKWKKKNPPFKKIKIWMFRTTIWTVAKFPGVWVHTLLKFLQSWSPSVIFRPLQTTWELQRISQTVPTWFI